jgi:predicted RNase H-related nuclease YkuK (DUF458 family)
MTFENERFISPTKGVLSVGQIVGEIKNFIDSEPDRSYLVVIGSDSQARAVNKHSEIDFVTAIIVHREGRGARYFWRKERLNMAPVLRDKIYKETQMSLDTAKELVPMLREAISAARYDFEIHIDVGPMGPTRDMIKEVTGMVQGNGFKAKTKPESWGASSVADKHT